MRNWRRGFIFLSTAILSLGFIYIVSKFFLLDFFADFLWFKSISYENYYLKRVLYQYIIFFSCFFSFFLFFFLNFWIASLYLGKSSKAKTEDKNVLQRFIILIQKGSLKIYGPFSLLFAAGFSIPFYSKWENALLCFMGTDYGIKDTNIFMDISFYFFALPFYTLIHNKLLMSSLLLLIIITFLCLIEKNLLRKDGKTLPGSAKTHLTLIALFVIALQLIDFILQCFDLFYTDNHMPKFYGPGFIEFWMDIPMIILNAVFFLITALLFIFYLYKKKGLKAFFTSGGIFLIVLTIHNAGLLSDTFKSRINFEQQEIFIKNTIKATLTGFNLDKVKFYQYPVSQGSDFSTNQDIQNIINNVPMWDTEILGNVYSRHQFVSPQYTFPDIDIDRYTTQGKYRQVYLAARELNQQTKSKWSHIDLKHNYGYGIVMNPASHGGEEPLIWFMKDIPVKTSYGFRITRPEIYYGTQNYPYVVALNNDEDKPDAKYSGKGGVVLTSMMERAFFALYFKNKHILTKTNAKSRILFRRNIDQAIKKITPFLILDDDPYIVTTSKGLFWIQDAYTMSDKYPYAQPYGIDFNEKQFNHLKFNYIRNSVKIIINAYDGDIKYYVSDSEDTIIRAYDRIYPGIFKPFHEMPEEFVNHMHYPMQLFNVQMDIYAKYHQENPEEFYNNKNQWRLTKTSYGYTEPHYMTLNLPEMKKQEFVLLTTTSHVKKSKYIGCFALARCDSNDYGKLMIYNIPKSAKILSPVEVSKLIKHDIAISLELKLLEEESQLIFGRMIVLPAGNSILYIQPLYLKSESSPLKRIIVSQGTMAVMDKSLEDALYQLETKLKKQAQQIEQRHSGVKKDSQKPASHEYTQ